MSGNACVALGMFDGVHLGHREVIESTVNFANEFGLTPSVFTFGTLPKTGEYITTYSLKTDIMREMGVREIYAPDFSEVRDLSAKDFITEILIKKMNAAVIICGWNFRFSKGAGADAETLKSICEPLGVKVGVIPPVTADGVTVSSTAIRAAIKSGFIESANKMLGYELFYRLPVITGRRIGSELGVPTVNQRLPDECAPPRFGVYKSGVLIDGEKYDGVTNIGVKPTVGPAGEPLLETHITGFDGDLYGKVIDVGLKRFVREERKFASLSELKNQIKKDMES